MDFSGAFDVVIDAVVALGSQWYGPALIVVGVGLGVWGAWWGSVELIWFFRGLAFKYGITHRDA